MTIPIFTRLMKSRQERRTQRAQERERHQAREDLCRALRGGRSGDAEAILRTYGASLINQGEGYIPELGLAAASGCTDFLDTCVRNNWVSAERLFLPGRDGHTVLHDAKNKPNTLQWLLTTFPRHPRCALVREWQAEFRGTRWEGAAASEADRIICSEGKTVFSRSGPRRPVVVGNRLMLKDAAERIRDEADPGRRTKLNVTREQIDAAIAAPMLPVAEELGSRGDAIVKTALQFIQGNGAYAFNNGTLSYSREAMFRADPGLPAEAAESSQAAASPTFATVDTTPTGIDSGSSRLRTMLWQLPPATNDGQGYPAPEELAIAYRRFRKLPDTCQINVHRDPARRKSSFPTHMRAVACRR